MNINPLLLILVIIIIYLIYKVMILSYERFSDEIPTVERPYINFYDNLGNKINVIGITKPFGGDHDEKIINEHEDKNVFIGVSSYLEFPNEVSNPFENFTDNYKKYRYKDRCKAWLSCFRDPENYYPSNVPIATISESDFCDCNINVPDKSLGKKYDFIYICLKVDEKQKTCNDWATYNKNWELAQKCLKVMCDELHMKGLLIGRKDCELPGLCHKYMDTTNMLSYDELKKYYNQSRFIFLPNYADASPRVLTEALSNNIPALVNKNILGGWKYINDETGEFFTDETDIKDSIGTIMKNILNRKYKPREHFINNYGIINSGKKLKDFLYNNFGDKLNIPKEKVEYITPAYNKSNYTNCQL